MHFYIPIFNHPHTFKFQILVSDLVVKWPHEQLTSTKGISTGQSVIQPRTSGMETVSEDHQSSDPQSLILIKSSTHVGRGQLIVCIALCSLFQVALIILWVTATHHLRRSRNSRRRKHSLREQLDTPLRKSSSSSDYNNPDDDETFFYRTSETGILVTRLDFLVDLVHLVNNFEEVPVIKSKLWEMEKL